MLNSGRDELMCDFAEYYGIYDWKCYPLSYVGTLASGLSENSRSKMKMANRKVTTDQMLLAGIVDRLSLLIWQNTEDGHKNRNKPVSILDNLLEDKENSNDFEVYASPEEFMKPRNKNLGD